MPTVRHKEAACVNISRDFMCLSPGKLIPVQRLCQYLGDTYSCKVFGFAMYMVKLHWNAGCFAL